MLTKMLLGVVATAGLSLAWFGGASTSAAPATAMADCCAPGAACCFPGSPCCEAEKADCCVSGAACCEAKLPCCDAEEADCCYPGSPCCYPGSPCCGESAGAVKAKGDCCAGK